LITESIDHHIIAYKIQISKYFAFEMSLWTVDDVTYTIHLSTGTAASLADEEAIQELIAKLEQF
jgi:hypothetical protein